MSRVETCHRCGHSWGVTTEPREQVLCSECATTPRLPEGEIRIGPDGTLAVCLGGERAQRWKVVGHDPHAVVRYGWRYDRDVIGWGVLGNVHDLKERAA